MTPKQRIEVRMSERRERVNTILSKGDDIETSERAELDQLTAGLKDDEVELRAAIAIEPEPVVTGTNGDGTTDPDRLELRRAAKVGNILKACLGSGAISGAEAELQQELGLDPNMIPLELWETEKRAAADGEPEKRNVTTWGASDAVGVNMPPIQPFVFAPSIAARLGVEMPTVGTGDYATATITTAATADAVARSADVPETAAAFTVATTSPHRVGASLGVAAEDIARVGTDTYESSLREHLSLVLSDELDDQMLNGDDSNDDIAGLLDRLTYPTDAISAVAGFDDFVAAFADQIDGLWASMMSHVSIVAGVDTYKLSAKTFRDVASTDLGDTSAADYLAANTAGWWTNKRMPATAANVQNGLACLKGRSMSLAVCPHWGYIGIDDVYTGRLKGERYFTIYTLIGDVILRQPDAYQPVRFKVS